MLILMLHFFFTCRFDDQNYVGHVITSILQFRFKPWATWGSVPREKKNINTLVGGHHTC